MLILINDLKKKIEYEILTIKKAQVGKKSKLLLTLIIEIVLDSSIASSVMKRGNEAVFDYAFAHHQCGIRTLPFFSCCYCSHCYCSLHIILFLKR